MIIPSILQQHVDDAALLCSARVRLTRAPYPQLGRILRFDRRLAAHLAGLQLSGEAGVTLSEAALESPSPGALFSLTVGALENKDTALLTRAMALAQAVPLLREGLLAAFGWVERSHLQGIVAKLLADGEGFRRTVAVAACGMHRVDPGLASGKLTSDNDRSVRCRAFRLAGELGLTDLLSTCLSSAHDPDSDIQFWSAWSAVLLGDRQAGLDVVVTRAFVPGPHRVRSFPLVLQAMGTTAAHSALQQLADDPSQIRWLIQGSGVVGDPAYAHWLIQRMTDLTTARLAGEAFALLTGANLGATALDGPAPEHFESGPNDNPDDPDVEMDPDDGLSWPDVEKIEKWWAANSGRFQKGTRYFVGKPVTREHCIDVLKTGYQRQRILAAHYLCLLEPGTPLFNTSAPAWRQQRLLAAM